MERHSAVRGILRADRKFTTNTIRLTFILPRELACQGIRFDRQDFVQAADVTFFLREPGREKGPHKFDRHFFTNDAGPEAQHVHVVVFDSLMGRVGVVADPCADAGNLVRGNADPDPAATQQDSAIRFASENRAADFQRKIGVIDAAVGISAAIDNDGSRGFNHRSDPSLEWKPTMITTESDTHPLFFLSREQIAGSGIATHAVPAPQDDNLARPVLCFIDNLIRLDATVANF
jgi:hypothetical protein